MGSFYRNLFAESWRFFIAGLGSTTLGFVIPLVLVPLVGLLLVFVVVLVREGRAGVMTHLVKTFTLAGIVAFCGEVLVYSSIFGHSVVSTIYQDHQTMAAEKAELQTKNQGLVSSMKRQDRGITNDDPAYMGLVQILRQFQGYGAAMQGKPCTIVFTSEPDSIRIAQAIAETSALVSKCNTVGPMPPELPDSISNKEEGLVPGAIVVHSTKETPAVIYFQRGLGNLLATRYSAVPPRNPHFAVTENVMWLQFGSGVGWRE